MLSQTRRLSAIKKAACDVCVVLRFLCEIFSYICQLLLLFLRLFAMETIRHSVHVIFCEPFAYVSLFPFVAFMVEVQGFRGCVLGTQSSLQDFHIAQSAKEVGYYAGFIASSFAFAQFFSGCST